MFSLRNALTILAGLAAINAAPVVEKRNAMPPAGIDDTVILQYALTLEHLEFTFYTQALEKFDAGAFSAAGFPEWVRNRFVQVRNDEGSHVALLTGAIGPNATQACTYDFPYTDPTSFVALAGIIENVGVSAYLGAADDIASAAYVTVAGSILTTEARHQTWISAAVDASNPWSSPYDTPLKYNGVYTLVAPFITSCPSSNPTLPVKAYPTLTSSVSTPGAQTQLSYDDSTSTEKYLLVYYGLSTMAIPIDSDKTVTLPSDIQGTAYAVVSSSSNTTVVDPTTIVAGPVILLNPFASYVTNPNPASAGQ
ncbi:MAG: hypothetical protein TREMPRED_001313 [Tremellales sp. Tagirdzhanova-0007]|nr:MAG: hypothetical protein TREMPRED_001313 [Tremellales sp. Tagirdzhanova-0007]